MSRSLEVQRLEEALRLELAATRSFGETKTFARRAMGLLKETSWGELSGRKLPVEDVVETRQLIALIVEASVSRMRGLDEAGARLWLESWAHVDDWFGLDLERLRTQLGPAT